ncbi:hypothetical protein SteCoe_15366 [Stentor coeruleus]|uniref:Palmitoyltransferase n=1 Tax=Stentor coeruleus TaxID=5963 RepID=A0A1R2C3T1_9CILI|nr:hypothetical protein SteCoe_15366 [Stentor coeruleus]
MLNKNGFTTPFHPYQICSWVILFWHTVIPATLIALFLGLPEKILFLTLFYISHIVVFIFGFKATKSNPTVLISSDPLYIETSDNLNYYCTICKSYVTKTSKHCGSCDRCVNNFDHHCKWLNNCIGEINYKLFIILISSLEISEIILLCFEIKTLSIVEIKAVLALVTADCILNGAIIILLGYLIGIHVVLKCRGMTTYEYIKSQRKKKENKVKPTIPEEIKPNELRNSSQKEIKKSIIKGNNKTVLENPCSFSVAKSESEEIVHLTFQFRCESELDLK